MSGMLQIIGLIVAAYAITRLVQIPIEGFAARGQTWAPIVLGGVSAGGALIVALLALALMFSGSTIPQWTP